VILFYFFLCLLQLFLNLTSKAPPTDPSCLISLLYSWACKACNTSTKVILDRSFVFSKEAVYCCMRCGNLLPSLFRSSETQFFYFHLAFAMTVNVSSTSSGYSFFPFCIICDFFVYILCSVFPFIISLLLFVFCTDHLWVFLLR